LVQIHKPPTGLGEPASASGHSKRDQCDLRCHRTRIRSCSVRLTTSYSTSRPFAQCPGPCLIVLPLSPASPPSRACLRVRTPRYLLRFTAFEAIRLVSLARFGPFVDEDNEQWLLWLSRTLSVRSCCRRCPGSSEPRAPRCHLCGGNFVRPCFCACVAVTIFQLRSSPRRPPLPANNEPSYC